LDENLVKKDLSPYKYPYYTKSVQDSFNRVINQVLSDMDELSRSNRLLSPQKASKKQQEDSIIPEEITLNEQVDIPLE
jgi:hypothetical protein